MAHILCLYTKTYKIIDQSELPEYISKDIPELFCYMPG